MGHFGQRKTPGENMKLFEKMCYKAGLKFGTAVYGQNMSAEEKRQLERQLYQQKLQEEKRAAASRRSGSSGSTQRRCCANCHYFMNGVGIGNAHYCAKHGIDFTFSDISDNVHLNSVCKDYSTKGYW